MTYNDIVGTSSTYVAINLNCSQSVACTGITLSSIQIRSDKSGQQVISKCTNAHGTNSGVVQPKSCLQSWPDNQAMYFPLGTYFFFFFFFCVVIMDLGYEGAQSMIYCAENAKKK